LKFPGETKFELKKYEGRSLAPPPLSGHCQDRGWAWVRFRGLNYKHITIINDALELYS